MNDDHNISGEEKIYLELLHQLGAVNLKATAAEKALSLQENGEVLVRSFGRNYFIGQKDITVDDGGLLSLKQKLAVLSYFLSESTGAPANDYVPFGHLGGFNIGREKHAEKSIKQPLLKNFGDDYELFSRNALKIGGTQQEGSSGKHLWLFYAFFNLPIQVIFYENDEEFPADIQVLFDSKALDYFGTKCLGFLPGYFTTTLIDAA